MVDVSLYDICKECHEVFPLSDRLKHLKERHPELGEIQKKAFPSCYFLNDGSRVRTHTFKKPSRAFCVCKTCGVRIEGNLQYRLSHLRNGHQLTIGLEQLSHQVMSTYYDRISEKPQSVPEQMTFKSYEEWREEIGQRKDAWISSLL